MNIYITRKQYLFIIGYFVILCGISVLLGWQFDVDALKSLIPDLSPVHPVVAVIFILSGIWLILFHSSLKHIYIIQYIAIFITLIGLIHFITYYFPCKEFRIDNLLYTQKLNLQPDKFLISPITSIVFCMCGIIFFTTEIKNIYVQGIRQLLILIGFSISYLTLIGYMYEIKSAYKFNDTTPMAIFSAIVFIFLYIGLFLTNTKYLIVKAFLSNLRGGHLLRTTIPFLLLLPFVIYYLWLLGEKKSLFPNSYGVGLYFAIFVFCIYLFITLYASMENKKNLVKILSDIQLADSEKKYKLLFNSFQEGAATINWDCTIILCNPSFCAITGYAENELTGKNIIFLLVPESEKKSFLAILRADETIKQNDLKAEIIKKNGEKIWVTFRVKTLQNQNKSNITQLITITDITEEILKIEDLRAFTASAAHDLNAPLSRISVLADFLKEDIIDGEPKTYLDIISETCSSMSQLLKDLLLFSKLSAGQVEKKNFELLPLVENIIKTIKPNTHNGEVIIYPLPSVNANESAIKQLYINLLSNAIKYSSKKEFSIVETGVLESNKQLVFYVKDNGVGLNAQQLKTIFTPFKRYHHDFEGNGMGLAIVKRIVDKHGGKIWLESIENEGLTVYFTLNSEYSL